MLKDIKIGVVTGPGGMPLSLLRRTQVIDQIAVRVEETDLRNCFRGKTFLPPRFADQACGREERWSGMLFTTQKWSVVATSGHLTTVPHEASFQLFIVRCATQHALLPREDDMCRGWQ